MITKRNIVHIDEEKCNGCGICIPSCAEGAIQIIDGKAKLIKDEFCDGHGACLGECPMDAITIIEREAKEFDEEAAMAHVARMQVEEELKKAKVQNQETANYSSGGCPGSRMRMLNTETPAPVEAGSGDISFSLKSQLQQWPVQLTLVPVQAPYFQNADLLITADCVPFAYPDYHPKLLKGKKVVIGCPKLDDLDAYVEKLTAIVKSNKLNSITVAFMEVPCCSGIVYAAEKAVCDAGVNIPVHKVRISLEGNREDM